jgi:hypothetical protein
MNPKFYHINQYKNFNIWAGGVVQVVECLYSKCEALSSNPCTAKKRKKGNKKC